jgi:hypothetical protein
VFDTFADAADEQPLLFVIDEFPDLLRTDRGFESTLRAIWSRVEGAGNLKVLICGSAVRTMEAGVCGGIPRYLALWDDRSPFKENLRELICNEQGILLSEGELVLADEEVTGARGQHLPEQQVLRTIGSGRSSYSQIEAALGTNPARALDHLERLQLVEKVTPVVTRGQRCKKLTWGATIGIVRLCPT